MKALLVIFLPISIFYLLICSALAMNSLVHPDDIKKMKQAGIGNVVIELLLAEQTSTITPKVLLKLREVGIDDKFLQEIVLSDRYKSSANKSSSKTPKEILKTQGLSDELIESLFQGPEIRTETDEQGNEKIIYKTGSRKEKIQTESSPSGAQYHINIEKVGDE